MKQRLMRLMTIFLLTLTLGSKLWAQDEAILMGQGGALINIETEKLALDNEVKRIKVLKPGSKVPNNYGLEVEQVVPYKSEGGSVELVFVTARNRPGQLYIFNQKGEYVEVAPFAKLGVSKRAALSISAEDISQKPNDSIYLIQVKTKSGKSDAYTALLLNQNLAVEKWGSIYLQKGNVYFAGNESDLQVTLGSERVKNFSLTSHVVSDNRPQIAESDMEKLKGSVMDLTSEALKKGPSKLSLDPLIFEKVSMALLSHERSSSAFLGNAGTGKSTDIETYVNELAFGKGPEELRKYRFLLIDIASLVGGTSLRGQFEEKIGEMIQLSQKYKIVWVVDEMHILKGIGSTRDGSSQDPMELLKPYLANGTVKMVGMTTPAEYTGAYGADVALDRRFTKVKKESPTGQELLKVLSGWFQRFNYEVPSEEILKTFIEMSERFSVETSQPSKTTDLIDKVIAYKRYHEFEGPITRGEIESVAVLHYNLDPALLNRQERVGLVFQAQQKVDELVIGQKEAKTSVIQVLRNSLMSGGQSVDSSLLLLGPKGQGKTALVEAASRAMKRNVVKINLAVSSLESIQVQIVKGLVESALTSFIFEGVEASAPETLASLGQMIKSGRLLLMAKDAAKNVSTVRELNTKLATFFFVASLQESPRLRGGAIGYNGPESARGESLNPYRNLKNANLKSILADMNMPSLFLESLQQVVYVGHLTKEELSEAALRFTMELVKQANERGEDLKNFQADHFVQSALKNIRVGMPVGEVERSLRDSFNEHLWQVQVEGYKSAGRCGGAL